MANCVSNKIDSNQTGLHFAEEVCPGQLPTMAADGRDPVWFELEPNEYDDFGPEITTVARQPINASRQRKKGKVVDLDAPAGFNHDLLQRGTTRLLQSFLFADQRAKPNTRPLNGVALDLTGVVASSDTYTAVSGLGRFAVGQLLLATGFTSEANNGVKRVASVAAGAVGVVEALVDETPPDDAGLQVVGYEFGAGDVSIVMDGDIPVLTIGGSAPAAATGTITIAASQNAAPGETVTIGGIVYTFVAGAPVVPYDVPIGGSRVVTAENLRKAINGAVLLSTVHPQVTATDNGAGIVTVTARAKGSFGNSIALSETGAQLSASGAALSGGTGKSWGQFGLIPGEWLFIGGDDTDEAFLDVSGYGRVKSYTDQALRLDKTTFDPVAQAASTLTIRVFFGDVTKNEKDAALVKTKSIQLQRTLGNDGDGVQAEYAVGAVPNELTINLALGEIINVDMAFVARDFEDVTGVEGLKDGVRMIAEGEEGFNTTSDMFRAALSILDPTTSYPTGLFAWVTEGSLSVNNNVSAVKAMTRLGGIDVSVGNFDVGGELIALFTSVRASRAVRRNASATFDAIWAKENAGIVYDVPLLTLGNGSKNIEAGEPVTIELSQLGAENPNGYTLLINHFAYLPDLAMPTQD